MELSEKLQWITLYDVTEITPNVEGAPTLETLLTHYGCTQEEYDNYKTTQEYQINVERFNSGNKSIV